MLPSQWRGQAVITPATPKCIWNLGYTNAAFARVVDFLEEVHVIQMWVIEQIVDGVITCGRNIQLGKQFDPFVRGPLCQAFRTDLEIVVSMCRARFRAIEPRICLQFRPADGIKKCEGLSVGIRADGDLTVLGGLRAIIGTD